MFRQIALVVLVLVLSIACGKDSSPTGPSSTTPTPTPAPPAAPARVTVFGVVRNSATGQPVGGASVRVAGSTTTTDGNGYYSVGNVQVGAINVAVTANGFTSHSETFPVQSNWQYDITLQFIPLFARSGSGPNVFDMPTREMRVRIVGDFPGGGENFVIWVGNRLVVNEILGTRWPSTHYEGTHVVPGGVVRVEHSVGLAWSITEVR